MTNLTDPDTERHRIAATVQQGMADLLADRGYPPPVVDALLELDATQFQAQRRRDKGEFLHVLTARLGIALEPAQLMGLYAVLRITHGISRPEPAQATIGLVAEELMLDPSRASRIVGDLVAAGFVAREAAQGDGRISILRLTPGGHDLILRLKRERWGLFLQVFNSWEPDDIITFSRLFARYSGDMQRVIAAEAVSTP